MARNSETGILFRGGMVMESSLKNQIYKKIADYVLGKETLKDLENWLIPTTWDLRGEPDKKAVDLANEVVLLLMEYSNGHQTEEEVKKVLREKVTNIFETVTLPPYGVETPYQVLANNENFTKTFFVHQEVCAAP